MARDPTFSGKDLIRFYERNLTADERQEVRDYFGNVLGGGPNYVSRQIFRALQNAFELISPLAQDFIVPDEEMLLFIAQQVEEEQRRRPRFQTRGGF